LVEEETEVYTLKSPPTPFGRGSMQAE
jgi:hypothetical protein